MYKEEEIGTNKYYDNLNSNEEANGEENEQSFLILNKKMKKSIEHLISDRKEKFIESIEELNEIILSKIDVQSGKYDESILNYIVFIIDYFLTNYDNDIRIYLLLFLRIYLENKIFIHQNLIVLNKFQKAIFKLFEFESDDAKFEIKETVNTLIIDCFCEIIRIFQDNSKFINIIRFCMNGEIQLNFLTQMKLIMNLSKYNLLSSFDDKKINSYIFMSIEYFINRCNDEEKKNICFKYIYTIYRYYPKLITYLNYNHIKKIINISNNTQNCEILNLVKNIMMELESFDKDRLLNIIQQIDINYYLLLIDSKNYKIAGLILDIFSICIVNFPFYFSELQIELWTKIMLNYDNFPFKIKSKSINFLASLLNPFFELSDEILFDSNLIEIISNHLHSYIFEDMVNSLFILQILIFTSIKLNKEDCLRELFEKLELLNDIEEIHNDERKNELNDDSIDNIFGFLLK